MAGAHDRNNNLRKEGCHVEVAGGGAGQGGGRNVLRERAI